MAESAPNKTAKYKGLSAPGIRKGGESELMQNAPGETVSRIGRVKKGKRR
jgi:hypothetical protein